MPNTTRWGLPKPALDSPADVPADIGALADALDDHAKDDQGLLASRPVSTAPSPGKKGRYYWATDTSQLFRDHGTGWTQVYPAQDLSSGLASILGVTGGGTVRRGKSIIATEETRTNAAYGLMPTPDRVSGIALPSDGLIFVAVQAMWKYSTPGPAQAAVFLNSTQLQSAAYGATAPSGASAAAGIGGDGNAYTNLASFPGGLASAKAFSGFAYTGDVTTGQLVGVPTVASPSPPPTDGRGNWGFMTIFAAAGTYDVTIQWLCADGVTAKNRKLWVWTMGF